jgi:hypothetical protein
VFGTPRLELGDFLTSRIVRVVSFVVPAQWLAATPQFTLLQLWYVSIAGVTLQAALRLWLVCGEFRRRARVVPAS